MTGDTIGSEYITAPTSVHSEATSGSSTTAYDITGGAGLTGFFDFSVKGADVHILFGISTVSAATTSNGMYIPAGATRTYWINDNSRYCRIIATSTVSGQAVLIARSGP